MSVARAVCAGRFEQVRRWPARLILAVVAILIGAGLGPLRATGPVPHATGPVPAATATRDADLYRAIAGRVAAGEDYYSAAATQHRAMGYPLKPFITVRPPLLAEATALAGGPIAIGRVMQALILATLLAVMLRLRAVEQRVPRVAALALAAGALASFGQVDLALWHEVWAGVLVTLGLAFYHPARWWPSVAIAVLAAVTRELAIPFLIVMGAAALIERRRGEALAWVAALVVAGGALALHAAHVAAVVTATDAGSPGWSGGGWATVVGMMGATSLFALLPAALVAVLVPLALLGWTGQPGPLARRAALWTVGMAATFAVVGRPDNIYWGAVIASLLPIGLAFAPAALRDLVKAAWPAHG